MPPVSLLASCCTDRICWARHLGRDHWGRGAGVARTTCDHRVAHQAARSAAVAPSPIFSSGPYWAALLVVTGLTAAWWYVGSIDALATSAYGRLLLLKLFLVADVATCGFLNWQRLRRPAAEAAGGDLFVTLEVALAVAVVIVTAVLTEVEHP